MATSALANQKELLDQWGKLTRTAFDSLKELGGINAKLMDKLSEQQQEIMKACLEASAREAQLVSTSKDFQELQTGQTTLASEYNERFLGIVRRTLDILTECREELATWVQKGVETATAESEAAAKGRR